MTTSQKWFQDADRVIVAYVLIRISVLFSLTSDGTHTVEQEKKQDRCKRAGMSKYRVKKKRKKERIRDD
jgi:hypothetical protein